MGKTVLAAGEGLAAMMEPRSEDSIGWICAPTYDLCDRVFLRMAMMAAAKLPHRIVKLSEHDRELTLLNLAGKKSTVIGKSADNPTSLLGEGLTWLVVDEAARIKASVWEGHLEQRLIDKKGWCLLISTPRGKTWFHDLFRRGQSGNPRYESWNAPSHANPYLDPAELEEQRKNLPERVYRQEILAEFLEGQGALFRNIRECATGAWKEAKAGETYFAGLDLGKLEDYTVLVIVNRAREIVFLDRFFKIDWGLQVARVKAATDRFNRCSVLVDSTGKGEPVFEALASAGIRVVPYTFTNKSKAALVDNLALMLEQKQIVLPRPDLCPDLIDELEAFEYTVSDSGNVKSGAPAGMHDDGAIACALAAWQIRPSAPRPKITFLGG